MILKNVKYLLSAPEKQYWPEKKQKEICIMGRSNVGKSTLINRITNNKNMAKVSKTPGYTKYLNFFTVEDKYYLVDTPGYGYAKININKDELFAKMMEEYLNERENLIHCILVIDGKIGFTNDDLSLLSLLESYQMSVLVIASKCDKLNQSSKQKLINNLKSLGIGEYILYSALDNSYEKIVDKILTIYNL